MRSKPHVALLMVFALALSIRGAFASHILSTENPLIGPPSATLSSLPSCFLEPGGAEVCTAVVHTVGHSNDVVPKPAPGGSGPVIMHLTGLMRPFPVGWVHDTYFLGNNLSGRYHARVKSNDVDGDVDFVAFFIGSDHLFPGDVFSDKSEAEFTATKGENYYAVVYGYARTSLAFDFQVAQVSEPATLALLVAVLVPLAGRRPKK